MTALRKKVVLSASHFTEIPTAGDWKRYLSNAGALELPCEKWKITVECREQDHSRDREQALICIDLPNGKILTGTIQQFQSLEAILFNAKGHMDDFAGVPMTDKLEEQNILDSCQELNSALSMFVKPK